MLAITSHPPYDKVKQFRLQVLYVYFAGRLAGDATDDPAPSSASKVVCDFAEDAAGKATCDAAEEAVWTAAMDDVLTTAAWYAVKEVAWYAAWTAAVRAEQDTVENVTLNAAGFFVRAKEITSLRQIAFASCRSVISDRKKIIRAIDGIFAVDTSLSPSSKSMTIEEMVKVCTLMLTFNDEKFKKFQLTVPLKLTEYLLECERTISFLHPCNGNYSNYHSYHNIDDDVDHQYHHQYQQYQLLMKKHSELVQRLGLEKVYLGLTTSRVTVDTLLVSFSQVSEVPQATKVVDMPKVLLKIIVGYCELYKGNSDDVDEIYKRLLTLSKFHIVT